MIYVASPYSHKELYVRINRYKAMLQVMAELARQHVSAYSPIVHWHPVEVASHLDLTSHELWKWSDIDMMSLSTEGIFIKIDGWEKSRGMKHEEEWLRDHMKPVTWLYPEEIQSWVRNHPVYGIQVGAR